MEHLIRVALVCGLIAAIVLIFGVSMAGDNVALMGPAHVLILLIVCAVYLVPTGLAVYRDCRALPAIAVLNVFLGWTVIGWFAVLGWAASGKPKEFPLAEGPHPGNPIPHHS